MNDIKEFSMANETEKVSQPEKASETQQTEEPKATSVDAGLEFEKIKRYVDSSISKAIDNILKTSQASKAEEPKKEEKKEIPEW